MLECEELNETDFDESVCCYFTDANSQRVLVGYIYRSPCSTEANNQELYHKLYNLISCEHVNTFDKVCIVGDFNFPTVKWNWE